MKFSERWLHEWVKPELDTQALAHQITMAGLEVDGIELAAPEFSGVVIGRIASIEPHPDADKLRVCQVEAGDNETHQVVCGAPNAREGMLAPFATVGARLPGDFKIKKAKLRGVPSFGMLCSAKELGLAESAEGLMDLPEAAPVGAGVRDYLDLDDPVVEVDLTPNRGDCLSIMGLAREVAVLNRLDIHEPGTEEIPAAIQDTLDVTLDAPAACPRYTGRVIRDIDPAAKTPLWMQERLRRCGIRPLNPVVDITNYVMLELGQPMHAFDLDRLEGGLTVRMARSNEPLTLLDGKEIALDDDMLVIADSSRSLAMAGVMGGEDSAVADGTRHVFLESAFFEPTAIAGRARRRGLHTDSSHRFERGVDPRLQRRALERATRLLLDIVGGKPGPVTEATEDGALRPAAPIALDPERATRLLGVNLPAAQIEDILQRLGMNVEDAGEGFSVTPPSFRFDIALEADLFEELARVYGYDNIPGSRPALRPAIAPLPENRIPRQRLRQLLVDRGYRETITYSFVEPALQQQLDPGHEPLTVANPISSEMSVMRTSLWPGLVKAAQYNLNRQQDRIRLFELGLRFVQEDGETRQEPVLGGIVQGPVTPEHWSGGGRPADFFDVKGDVEALLELTGQAERITFRKSAHAALHPGQGADILCDGEVIGQIGALHPTIQSDLGIDAPLFVFQLAESALVTSSLPTFQPLPRYPAVRRDLALIAPEDLSVGEIEEGIRANGPETLQDVVVFDIYRGKGVEEGHKSVALGLILQDFSRTLSDDDVDRSIDRILAALRESLGVTLRD